MDDTKFRSLCNIMPRELPPQHPRPGQQQQYHQKASVDQQRRCSKKESWLELGALKKFEANCKAAVKNDREVVSLKKVDLDYWKVKLSKVDKNEERKRKREEMRDNREQGWQVAHVDEWNEEEETNQQNEENGRAATRKILCIRTSIKI
jgi:hypothetical protein